MRADFPLTFVSDTTASCLLVICPCCKKAFIPRTSTQKVCGLQCFYAMKRGKRTESEPVVVDAFTTLLHDGEGQANRACEHSSRQVKEDAVSHDLKQRVMEAAGTDYLTEAQIIKVMHSLTRSTEATTPRDVGIAALMQLIELARSGGLDDNE